MEAKLKDDILKPEFLAATPSHKIIYRVNEGARGYQDVIIEEGCLVLQCKKAHWNTNVYELSNYRLEMITPSTTALPVVIKMSIQNRDE